MAKRLSEALRRFSNSWVALTGLGLFLLFTAVVLPREAARTATYAGEAGTPDTSLWYSSHELYEMAEAYGPEGRSLYVRSRLTFDVIWPLVYTFFLTTAISCVYDRAVSADSRWRLANLAPILAAALDFLENGSASLVMVRYPLRTPVVDTGAGLFTLLKWICIAASFLFLIGGFAAYLWRRVRRTAE